MGEGGFLPPLVARILADTSEFGAKLKEAAGEAEEFTGKSGGSFQKLAHVGKAALLGLTAGAVGLGAEAVHLADSYENAHVRMVQSITDTGAQYSRFSSQITTTDQKMQGLGFTNTQAEQGLSSMVTATGSTSKALSLMGLAADVARYKNVDLSTASVLVAKASEGQSRALKSLGIDLNVAAGGAHQLYTAHQSLVTAEMNYRQALASANAAGGKSLSSEQSLISAKRSLTVAQDKFNQVANAGTQITDALSKKLGGQASTYADTFAGRLKVVEAQSEDLGIKFGSFLIPKLEKVLSVVEATVSWFGKHKAAAIALGTVVGGFLTLAIGAYIASVITAQVTSIAAFLGIGAAAEEASGATVAGFASMIASGATWVATQVAGAATATAAWVVSSARTVASFTASTAAMVAQKVAMVASAVATKAFTLAQAALDVVMDANPIVLVAAAVIAVGVAFYEAYKHCTTFRNIVNDIVNVLKTVFMDTFHAVERVVGAVVGFISDHWRMLGPIILLPIAPIVLLITHFHMIVTAAEAVWHGVTHWFGVMLTFVKGIPGDILKALGDLGNLLFDAGKAVVDGLWNGMKSVWHHVTGWVQDAGDGLKSGFKKVLSIFSPSRVFHGYGQNIVQGLVNGLQEGLSDVKRFGGMLADAVSAGWTGSQLQSKVNGFLQAQQQRIQTATSNLRSTLQARTQAVSSLAGTIGGVDLSSLIGTDSTTGATTVANLGTYLSNRAASAAALKKDLRLLSAKHLSNSLEDMLAGLGSTNGALLAQQILSGQAGSIASLNASYKATVAASTAGAATVVNPQYANRLGREREELHEQVESLHRIERLLERLDHAGGNSRIDLHVHGDSRMKLTPLDARDIASALHELNRTTRITPTGTR